MRRTTRGISLLMASVMTVGCTKPYFMTELDYNYYNRISAEYERAEYTDDPIVPVKEPRTVRDPGETDKEPWWLTLEEAKRLAILHNKQIAYLGFRPGESGTVIDLRLSAFDAYISAGGAWSYNEQQVLSNIQVIGTGQTALSQRLFGGAQAGYGVSATQGGATQDIFSSLPGQELIGIYKRNATGGLTRLTYTLDYQNIFPVNIFTQVNPAWRGAVNVGFEQPLLQGAGVEYNRAPIMIARANYEQSIKDFQANVQTLLRDVELAYWQIHFAYQDLFSRETGMKQALATWQKEKNKFEVGTGAVPDVAQAREQYEFYRASRLQALSRVLASERDLRKLLGYPPDDFRRIIPADYPTIAEYQPNWQVAVRETMELRPELSAQRFLVRAAELEVFRQKNGLLPDLTISGTYSVTGLDNNFDEQIITISQNQFTTWVLGGRFRQQIGERAAHASVRRANLALSRERATLHNLEHTYLTDLHEAFQNVIFAYDLIQVQKDRREAAFQQLEAREQFYRQGKTTIDVLLQAQTAFADALRDESQAIVTYNQNLARWEFTRGTILNNDNVVMMEEEISRMKPKALENRKKQLLAALPIPMHPGNKVHAGVLTWAPDPNPPLYPDFLLANPLAAPDKVRPTVEGSAPKFDPGSIPPKSSTGTKGDLLRENPTLKPQPGATPPAVPGNAPPMSRTPANAVPTATPASARDRGAVSSPALGRPTVK